MALSLFPAVVASMIARALSGPRVRALTVLALALVWVPVPAQPRERAVLVLFSDEGRLPATTTIYDGIEQGLSDVPGITLLSQYLDTTNFSPAQHEAEMTTFLTSRYADRKVDVVITIAPPATTFADRHGAVIWPGARRVAVAFPGDDMGGAALLRSDAHVPVIMDFRATIEAALTLLPATREIVLVAGSSASDQSYLARAQSELGAFAGRVRQTVLTGLTLASFQDRLAAVPDNAVVLVAVLFEDADGRRFLPAEAVQALAQRSRRPIFGVHDSWLGRGVVGGHAIDYVGVGRQAAAAALALLNGQTPITPPPATHWVFDARELDRWGIDERRLPQGAKVLFRAPSAWVRYRWWIVAAAVALALQAAIIGALLVERRARRRSALSLHHSEAARQRTEAQMQLHLHELAHVNVLAAIGQNAAAMAHELNQPLTAVLSNAQALQLMLERQGTPNPAALEVLDDIISEDKRAGDVIQRMRRLMKKEMFDWAPVDVNAIVEDVTRLIGPEAAHSGVRLVADLTPGLPAARGDRVQLQQVMLNLVQNGVHAAAGRRRSDSGVRVATSLDGAQLNVSVRDSGPGIDAQTLPRLFDPFFTTKATGLGLGLSISRTIVEQHGGTIAARNAPGGGAEFCVRLPAAETAA